MIEVELIINKFNDKCYYIKDTNIYHREDGPAVEYINGTKIWYQHDKRHRVAGPAVELANGTKSWFLDDKKINCNSQQEFENSVEFRSFKLRSFW